MALKKHNKDNSLITDSGILENTKQKKEWHFVILCNILSVCLALLGLVAFIKGNF